MVHIAYEEEFDQACQLILDAVEVLMLVVHPVRRKPDGDGEQPELENETDGRG